MSLRQESLLALAKEIQSARLKFPRPSQPFVALGEEYGELSEALYEKQGRVRVRAESVQVAAVAFRLFEEGDDDYDMPPHPIYGDDKNTVGGSYHTIEHEVERSRKAFPGNKHMLAALAEEIGEVARALLVGDFDNARVEAIQTAATAMRIFEEGDATYLQPDQEDW